MGERYGQHFLASQRAVAAILGRFDPGVGDRVVEIGPGRGALTRPLAEGVGAFAAIEVDRELASKIASELGIPLLDGSAALRSQALAQPSGDGMQEAPTVSQHAAPFGTRFVLCADALDVLYADLAVLLGGSQDRPLRIIANLPYAVATALIRRMIAERHLIQDAVLMVQKEVADRLLASPGRKEYGMLSVVLALTADRERVLDLGPGAFSPPPKVRSTVVSIRFVRQPAPSAESDGALETMLKIIFSERRKKMASNLARGYAMTRQEAAARMEGCGADPGARAEQVAPEILARLASVLPAAVPRVGRAGRAVR